MIQHGWRHTTDMDSDDGRGDRVAPIPLWRTPGDIRRRATYDDRYAAWVECYAPEGTEEAIARALESFQGRGDPGSD
jgi:hypothetical protein